MKYIIVLGDGMADYPVEELGGKTPLQYAIIHNIDYLAKHGVLGMVKTVPEEMSPGSDTANMSVLGYNPLEYYSGRSPFEATSMGVKLKETDVTFRCNLVTLAGEGPYQERVIIDHSSDEISTEEAKELMEDVSRHFSSEVIRFYPGISYRHLMVWDEGPYEWDLTPPHDILEREVGEYLPKGKGSEIIEKMMRKSFEFLSEHKINKKRVKKGLNPANSIWIWGEGKKPSLDNFTEKYNLKGSVISAVDLVKGIAICAGLDTIEVEGATGNIHTNFYGKAKAALKALEQGQDFVYIHIEAPDECGHRYEIKNKTRAIELIDEKIVKTIKEELDKHDEDYKIMVLPDHATPLSLRTHTKDPVPFVIYERGKILDKPEQVYDEDTAKNTGLYIGEGYKLMDYFVKGDI